MQAFYKRAMGQKYSMASSHRVSRGKIGFFGLLFIVAFTYYGQAPQEQAPAPILVLSHTLMP
jgi:hypothetical protein